MKTDGDYRQMVRGGVLNRKEIAKECGFGRSVVDQNPRIKAALHQLETDLRYRGILPPPALSVNKEDNELPRRVEGSHRSADDRALITRLENQNACLRAEVAELKSQLERYASIHEALTKTGRIPR